ncbi:hypothetical protein MOQ72_09920 [Saccharopolyspora sp. K220]|uniref:hypothetical protein n=1 Tax=Saccharopolyspora soli TaxID=2926618 RepID=UPI001F58C201|nr:hypothetical protein [Saccharopolyspora soli]MCI2417742.1 hypothetical protein [Saccharopolyspora soli]
MHRLLQHQRWDRHRLLTDPVPLRRRPVTCREIAERLFRHTKWVQRKPGAMWDAVPAAPRAAAR